MGGRRVIDDDEFLGVIKVAVEIHRERRIQYCVSYCMDRGYTIKYCMDYCTKKYRDTLYFSKADFIKAAAVTDTLYHVKIETLLRKLRKWAEQQKYIRYIDRRKGVYKLVAREKTVIA